MNGDSDIEVIVTWTAKFQTKINLGQVDKDKIGQAARDEAANIDIDGIENTEYISDTWEVEDISVVE